MSLEGLAEGTRSHKGAERYRKDSQRSAGLGRAKSRASSGEASHGAWARQWQLKPGGDSDCAAHD